MTSVIRVFETTSKVLELVPLAEPAAKVFENAASVLEEVQVSVLHSGPLPMICTDERTNPSAILGECRRRSRFDSANGTHPRRSSRMRASVTASHATAHQQTAGVGA
jgi:hypothetical protein